MSSEDYTAENSRPVVRNYSSAVAANTDAKKQTRRRVLKALAGLGIGSAVFQRALAAQAEKSSDVTADMIQQAEWIAGLELSEADRKSTAGAVNRELDNFRQLRAVALENSDVPAILFHPAPWLAPSRDNERGTVRLSEQAAPIRPQSEEELAFLPVTELAALIRTREVSSVELTRLYLKRLQQFDPALLCVVTLTEELALKQAERADRELAAGRYRGPLHGIPWGAKDLISVRGYKTTWGAPIYQDQSFDVTATVADRLERAGAILVAKLSLGALAMGDRWFGGKTRNPWNTKQGSSGSSAGSASATAAGLVGFALGSETLGSIVSPCRRCGTTGLRPTFGRVSRYGCMSLSWSMDKIGPITRSVEDCALVFGALHGFDGLDPTAVDRPFHWPSQRDLRTLKVGYFETDKPMSERPELQVLTQIGVKLIPVKLPDKYPVWALTTILDTEAATVFDEITRKGITEGLNSWPGIFRLGQFVPAVEYLRANRIRRLLMEEMKQVMSEIDLYVEGNDLGLTNLTGHPTVVLPNGFRKRGDIETPTSITFTGRLYGETELLVVAHAYQQMTGHHLKHPPMKTLQPIAVDGSS
jgi:Asp-tRNA(Asn)/Glu-tRNA(Gln) amidotransferase A subunit family amidase